jgi:hypothetical protein
MAALLAGWALASCAGARTSHPGPAPDDDAAIGAGGSSGDGGTGGSGSGGTGGTGGTTGGAGGTTGGTGGDTGGTGGDTTGGTGGALPDAATDSSVADDAAPPADHGPGPDLGPVTDAPPQVGEPTCARKVPVSTLAALSTAIGAAKPGDCIVVANGSYTSPAPISVASVGTAQARITITAETIGGVTITGTAGFHLDAPAAYVTIHGFKFTHAQTLVMAIGTSHCAILRNDFQLAGPSGQYLYVQGLDHEVGFNSFHDKAYSGSVVQLDASGRGHSGTERAYLHDNLWLRATAASANGNECIATWSGFIRIEHNVFQECNGDPEVITLKSSDAVVRYNTFRTSTRGQLSVRYSNRDVIDGNFFFGLKGGLRIYGKDHKVTNNYFENNAGIGIYISDGTADGGYIQIERLLVAHNTLIGDDVRARSGGLPPLTVTFADNIIRKDGGNFVTPGPGWDVTYSGNIFFGTASAGMVPAAGFRMVDPKLAAGPGGTQHLQAGSPAIDSAVGSFGITEDMDGQPRVGKLDVGADEVSTVPVKRGPLMPADVGPMAGL